MHACVFRQLVMGLLLLVSKYWSKHWLRAWSGWDRSDFVVGWAAACAAGAGWGQQADMPPEPAVVRRCACCLLRACWHMRRHAALAQQGQAGSLRTGMQPALRAACAASGSHGRHTPSSHPSPPPHTHRFVSRPHSPGCVGCLQLPWLGPASGTRPGHRRCSSCFVHTHADRRSSRT